MTPTHRHQGRSNLPILEAYLLVLPRLRILVVKCFSSQTGNRFGDLNGDLMENGSNIGGDNTSSQSVIAVAVPQEPTLYYLFTTQASANGSNEVNFLIGRYQS